jgi:hypothetical protein
VINIYVKRERNAICHNTITFDLYFSGSVRLSILYVKNIVIVVHINVIMDNIKGNIAQICIQFLAVSNVAGIDIMFDIITLIISIAILHISHAIRLQAEFIKTD